jgi:hypothetical protein
MKHEKSFVDFEKPYEQNVIGLKGIFYFGIGLFLLIVITFGLMWAFRAVLEDDAKQQKASTNPMIMTEKERLPPEPRIQAAPGFGVESDNGRVNLELKAPQSEYWELKKQWEDAWKYGRKDEKTGTVISMSIDQAKEKLLQQTVKAKSGADADKTLTDSRMVISDSSAGRMATLKRR